MEGGDAVERGDAVVVNDALDPRDDTVRRYHHSLVVITLAAGWASLLSALLLQVSMLLFGGVLIAMFLSAVISLTPVAMLVCGILGGMWRRWLDGLSTAAFLVVAMIGAPFIFATVANTPGACESPDAERPMVCVVGWPLSTAVAGLVVVGLLVVALAITWHWLDRLRWDHRRPAPRGPRSRPVVTVIAAAVLVALAILALVAPELSDDSGSGVDSPDSQGSLTITNDLGVAVSVTVCPRQDCSGRQSRAMRPGASIESPLRSGDTPDSVIISEPGRPDRCLLLPVALDYIAGSPIFLSQTEGHTCTAPASLR